MNVFLNIDWKGNVCRKCAHELFCLVDVKKVFIFNLLCVLIRFFLNSPEKVDCDVK